MIMPSTKKLVPEVIIPIIIDPNSVIVTITQYTLNPMVLDFTSEDDTDQNISDLYKIT